jgi:5-methylcytosine-specific restriction endonuclease McrA
LDSNDFRRQRIKEFDQRWTPEMERMLFKLQPTCVVCGGKEKLGKDHVKPLSKSCGLEPGNVVVLCNKCNGRKSDFDVDRLPSLVAEKIKGAARQFKKTMATIDQNHGKMNLGEFYSGIHKPLLFSGKDTSNMC